MVDRERLHRLLRGVTDGRAVLRSYEQVDAEALVADPVRLGHVKYVFITMLEGCLDAAHHVCASEGFGPADTNADAMRLLGRHGVVGRDLSERMAQAVGRNVLVHGYATVDDRRVVAKLQQLEDVEAYVDALASLL